MIPSVWFHVLLFQLRTKFSNQLCKCLRSCFRIFAYCFSNLLWKGVSYWSQISRQCWYALLEGCVEFYFFWSFQKSLPNIIAKYTAISLLIVRCCVGRFFITYSFGVMTIAPLYRFRQLVGQQMILAGRRRIGKWDNVLPLEATTIIFYDPLIYWISILSIKFTSLLIYVQWVYDPELAKLAIVG